MAAFHLWAWSKRDPADAERERQAFEEQYQAVIANEKVRVRLIACTEIIIAAWKEGGAGTHVYLWLMNPIIAQLEQEINEQAIAYGDGLPEGDTLIRAQVFLTRFLDASCEGSPNLSREQGWFGRGQAADLSWEEAVRLVREVGMCLREGHDINNPRLLRFLNVRL